MWSSFRRDGTPLIPLVWKGGNQELSVNEILNEFKKEDKSNNQKLLMFLSRCACITANSTIFTNKGLIMIKELFDEKIKDIKVMNYTDGEISYNEIDNYYYYKDRDIMKIITKYGFELKCTPKHKIVTLTNDGQMKFVEAKTLKVGDSVPISYGHGNFGENVRIVFDEKQTRLDMLMGEPISNDLLKGTIKIRTGKIGRDCVYPYVMNEELAEFLGYYISEGNFNEDNNTVFISNSDEKINKRVGNLFEKVFNYNCEVIIRDGKDRGRKVSSMGIIVFLKRLGLGGKSKDKEIPKEILRSSKEVHIAFLKALFSGDGCVYKEDRSVEYSSMSEKLVRQVQLMLLNLGIFSNFREKDAYCEGKYCGKSYGIFIHGNDVLKFRDIIGFTLEYRQKDLCEICKIIEEKGVWHGRTVCGIESFLKEIYENFKKLGEMGYLCDDIMLENGEKCRRWYESASHALGMRSGINRRWSTTQVTQVFEEKRKIHYPPSKEHLYKLLNLMKECNYMDKYQHLMGLCTLNVEYDKIESIEYGLKEDVYDLTIKNIPHYIANGFLVHNSGKSLCILEVIKEIGRGIVIVPSLKLQDQYRNDYSGDGDKYVLKNDGTKLKIGTLIGRKNFTCRYLKEHVDKGITLIGSLIIYDKFKIHCGVRGLPCNRSLRKGESRVSVGCECKWFVLPPRIKSDIDEWEESGKLESIKKMLRCDEIKYYKGIDKCKYGLFMRDDETVCEYYRQFYNYLNSDVIIFNRWKWEVETNFGRKPIVDVECIDECDEFLWGLNESINVSNYMLDSLYKTDKNENIVNLYIKEEKNKLLNFFSKAYDKIKNDEINRRISNDDYGLLNEVTKFIDNINQMVYEGKIKVSEDDLSDIIYKIDLLKRYGEKAVMSTMEAIKSISVCYNIPYPDYILKDLLSKCCNKVLFSSATMPSDDTLKRLFDLKFDKVILGRKDQPGKLTIMKPKYDMVNVTYNNWQDEEFRNYYNNLLRYIVVNLNEKGNTLVLTPAKRYVERLVEYLKGRNAVIVVDFSGDEYYRGGNVGNEIIISYRQKRGIDLRGDLGRVMVWTKFPLVDLSDSYIRSLFGRFGEDTWEILNDMAKEDAIQGVCRCLRSDDDWAVFATPDIRVYDVIDKWWNEEEKKKQN